MSADQTVQASPKLPFDLNTGNEILVSPLQCCRWVPWVRWVACVGLRITEAKLMTGTIVPSLTPFFPLTISLNFQGPSVAQKGFTLAVIAFNQKSVFLFTFVDAAH